MIAPDGSTGIPKTPDHCAAREYAHSRGVKPHDTCNRCTNPDPGNPCDCPLLGALDDIHRHLIPLRITTPPVFDKPEYTPVCEYVEKDELRFIEQNDDTIRIIGSKDSGRSRNTIVEISKELVNND